MPFCDLFMERPSYNILEKHNHLVIVVVIVVIVVVVVILLVTS